MIKKYKGYEIEIKDGKYISKIEDGIWTYSWLIDEFATLKEAKARITAYKDRINKLYKTN